MLMGDPNGAAIKREIAFVQTVGTPLLIVIACDLVPERPNRSEPRARKRSPKNFQLLTKPRVEMGNLPRRKRPARTS